MKTERIILYILITIVVLFTINSIKTCNQPVKTKDKVEEYDSLQNKIENDIDNFNNRKIERINNRVKENEKLLKEINTIPNSPIAKRDSMWTILLNSKDSLPRKYWDILESRTRRESTGNF